MSDVNVVALSGRLTRDPELTYTPSGTAVLRVGLAVNMARKSADGKWEDEPNYVDCELFGRRAEALAKVLAKGQLVLVSGRLRWRSWERDGERRSRITVVVGELRLAGEPRGREGSPAPAPVPAEDAAVYAADAYGEEIPF